MKSLSIEDRLAIEDLVHLHAWYADHDEEPRMAELYAEDGQMLNVEPEPIKGRAAIAAWGRARQGIGRKVRHVMSNLRILIEDGDVVGHSILTLYRHDGEGMGAASPLLIADCHDRYIDTAEGWRLAERKIELIFLSKR